ncbi:hypothetical protein CGMCC3_g17094 [Colletotrichum fructicola]|nr:uncharacterized protein CGMCC3_g17094 [Colletotrichum fructicola]KAE9566775.1 hypothetical protein CGMCC3_g17094 [Colletotrichum fructicola]
MKVKAIEVARLFCPPALWAIGEEEVIYGYHDFTIDDQTTVIANGVAIVVYGPDSKSIWHGKDTGDGGQKVSKGYKECS